MIPFFGQERKQLQTDISKIFGISKAKHRADSLFRQVYKKKCSDTTHFSGLHKNLIFWLQSHYCFDLPLEILSWHLSTCDASIKFVMRAKEDGAVFESVLIPERGRLTQCLSTQVGCAQKCRFCQTGRMGLLRNLKTEEIVAQFLLADQWRATHQHTLQKELTGHSPITNLVYMGMGEPLDNLEHVLTSTHIFCDPLGPHFSPNKITLSTVGLLPALKRVLLETKVCLALSVHSPFEQQRTKIMPVNNTHPLTKILDTIKEFPQKRPLFVQYILLRGINDSPEHAKALVKLLQGLKTKTNLIPLNEHPGAAFRRPDLQKIYSFQQELKQAGMIATIRLSKGRDIQAACGQLIKDKLP
jgi:23S rRNA (adenine2503-C2)-methyltransferase